MLDLPAMFDCQRGISFDFPALVDETRSGNRRDGLNLVKAVQARSEDTFNG